MTYIIILIYNMYKQKVHYCNMVEGEEGCQARDWVLLQTCWHAEGWHVLHGHVSMHLHVDTGVQMCWHEMQMVTDTDGGHWHVGVLACRRGWWWMWMRHG